MKQSPIGSAHVGKSASLAGPAVLLHGDDSAVGHREHDVDPVTGLGVLLVNLKHRPILAAGNQAG